MAPETMMEGRVSKAADMYAFGITLWELYTGGQPYKGEGMVQVEQLAYLWTCVWVCVPSASHCGSSTPGTSRTKVRGWCNLRICARVCGCVPR